MSLKSTAIHEAAHAVIGRVLGLACGEASIVAEDPDALGHAIIDNPLRCWERGDGPRRKLVDAFCVALFSGAEAERVILAIEPDGDETDCERATNALKEISVRGAGYVGDEIWERYEASLRRKANATVRRHRGTIQRVAEALIERKTLTAEEIDALLEEDQVGSGRP